MVLNLCKKLVILLLQIGDLLLELGKFDASSGQLVGNKDLDTDKDNENKEAGFGEEMGGHRKKISNSKVQISNEFQITK